MFWPGNGTTQLIHLLARTLGVARAAIAIPTFSEFANALAIAGVSAAPIYLDPDRGYAFDLAGIQTRALCRCARDFYWATE